MRGKWTSTAFAILTIANFATPLPASAAECAPLGLITTLDLIELPSGRPGVAVKIADTPKTMLIDTGAFSSLVTTETVRDLNLTQVQNGRGVRSVNGAESSMLARLPTIEIGRFRQENALFYVMPAQASPAGRDFDGILGGEWLKNYDADFDFAAKKLNMFSQDHCAGKVVYWQPKALAVLPFQLDGNHIKFRVELDGKRVDAILDTGANATFFSLAAAQRMFQLDVNAPDMEKAGEITGGYTGNMYRRRFKTLAFEGVTIRDPELILMPDFLNNSGRQAPPTGSLVRDDRVPEVTLGMTVLSQMHVYVAYKERKVYITSTDPNQSLAVPLAP